MIKKKEGRKISTLPNDNILNIRSEYAPSIASERAPSLSKEYVSHSTHIYDNKDNKKAYLMNKRLMSNKKMAPPDFEINVQRLESVRVKKR